MPPYVFCVAAVDDNMSIADVADPAVPILVGNIRGAGAPSFLNFAYKIKVHGNFAYVVNQIDLGLTILDVSDLANPAYAGGLYGAGNFLDLPSDVFIGNGTFNGFAYISVQAGAEDGLTIVDISDPANPTYVGGIYGVGAPNFLDSCRSLYVRGDYAYMCAGTDNRLTIINVSNPAAPTFVSSIGGVGMNTPMHVVLRGNYAYIASGGSNALVIIEISNPAIPVWTGSIAGVGAPNWLWGARRVGLYGPYAIVCAALEDALTLINIANPAAPAHVISIFDGVGPNAFDTPYDIVVEYPYAYVAAYANTGTGNRMAVIDITNPLAPVYVGALLGPGAPNYMWSCAGVALYEYYIPQVQTNPATEIS